MQVVLPEELKKWVYYDIKKFKYVLKENSPIEIKRKFKEYEERHLETYKT